MDRVNLESLSDQELESVVTEIVRELGARLGDPDAAAATAFRLLEWLGAGAAMKPHEVLEFALLGAEREGYVLGILPPDSQFSPRLMKGPSFPRWRGEE